MGYRSDVAYTIRFTPNRTGDNYEDIKASFNIFLEQVMHDEDTKECFTEEKDERYPTDGLNIDREGLAINFFASSLKWYEDYPDVKRHEALLQTARDWLAEDNPHSKYLGYAFCRVGEDVEDCVEDVGGNADYEWVSISRQVICDWL